MAEMYGRREFLKVLGYGLAAGSLYGCVGMPLPLSPDENKKLRTIDSLLQKEFFTDEAQAALKNSPLVVTDLFPTLNLKGKSAGGIYFNNTRHINRSSFCRDYRIEDIIFHETIHFFDDNGYIDRQAFSQVYNSMSEKRSPIKAIVQQRMRSHIPISLLLGWEKRAYTAQYWKMDDYEVPEEMKKVFGRGF